MQCHYCKQNFSRDPRHPKYKTKDHIIPRSKGGMTISSNIVYCCRQCNVEKGSISYQDFVKMKAGESK